MRFDNVMKPARFFSRARTYSIIIHDGYVYFINTGPGLDIYETAFGKKRFYNKQIIEWKNKKVEEGERKIDDFSLDKLVEEKNNFKITKKGLQDVKLDEFVNIEEGVQKKYPRIRFKLKNKSWKLFFLQSSIEEVAELIKFFQIK